MTSRIILNDSPLIHTQLLPLTFTRPVGELMIGMTAIRQKWERALPGEYSYASTDYLSELYPMAEPDESTLFIASNLLPDPYLVEAVASLDEGEALVDSEGSTLAWVGVSGPVNKQTYDREYTAIRHTYDIFSLNGREITSDFAALTSDRRGQAVSRSCTVIGDPSQVFIEEGATVEGAFLNTKGGPIYIGVGAEVMEGSCMRGPIAILDHATVNMGAKIYGATTIGQHSKVGGELNNVVMFPYSNKAHDGFLGNAVIGSWCNLGGGSVASNLKNDYTEIKLWDYQTRRFAKTGLQFCGLIMGDHSKAGINTMFNTATVVGVGVNIHGTGFPRNFVASFSEGGATAGFTDVPLSKFFAIAERVMARRNITLTDADRRLFTHLFELTQTYK